MNLRVVALNLVVALVLLTGTADAHIRDDSGFLFGGMTLDKDQPEKKVDPINVLYYPYARALDAGNTARVHTHHKAHWRPHWSTADEFSNAPACKGNQRLLFRGGPAERPENEDHGAGWVNNQAGPWDNCRARYHIRMWSDTSVVNDTHAQERDTWLVGDMHHERVRGFSVNPLCPTVMRSCSSVKFKGHYIDRGWEEVELATITKMRRKARTSGHLDARGEGANQGHCNKYKWKPLPGSGPNDDIQDFGSDGWVTRISLLHCARGTR